MSEGSSAVIYSARIQEFYEFNFICAGIHGKDAIYVSLCFICADLVPLIGYFGENGDGYDRSTHFLNETSVSVHCGSGLSDVELHWLFADRSQVGTSSRNIYEGRHDNGTTTLYITNQLRLSYCDAGTYVCMANRSGYVQEREFTLMIGRECSF